MKGFVVKMDRSRVIKASAGTGKTYRLSVEILALLFSGVEISEVFSITFTRKAAAEIRDRVIEHLDKLAAHLGGEDADASVLDALNAKGCEIDIEKTEQLRNKLLTNKKDFQVMTIDAFVNSVFSGLIAPYLQIDDFSLVDNSLNEEIIDEVLLNILRDKDKKKSLNVLIKLNRKIKNLSRYKKFISFAANKRFVLEKIQKEPQQAALNVAVLKQDLDKMVSLIIQTSGSYTEVVNKNCFQPYDQNISEKEFSLKLKTEYKDMLKLKNFWSKAKLKEINEELEEMYLSYKEKLSMYVYQTQIIPLMSELNELLSVVLGTYDEIKLKKKAFTYQDIAYYTYRYLYDDEMSLIDLDQGEVLNIFYEALSSKVKYLLIDEFQDTSIIQWNILFPLIKEIASGSELSGGVICVGDDKQAIYGWRGGEKDLLNDLESILEVQDAEVLGTSYRSSSAVMSFVNDVFLSIAGNVPDWGYENVKCHKQDIPGYVEVRVSRLQKGEYELVDEIDKIVETFSELLSANKLSSKGTAILLRTSKEMELAAVALKKREIPFVLESSSSILDHKAIKPILYLLKYLVTGQIPLLYDFIRSDYLGYSLKDLTSIFNASREGKDILALTPLSDIVEFLNSLLMNEPLEQIIIRMLSQYRAGEVFSQLHDQKNIRRFLEVIRDFQLSQGEKQSISDLLRFFEKRRKTEVFRQVGLESSDSVQIMTIHKSKGMEFDNVFYLLNLSAKEPPQDDYILYSEYSANFNEIESGVVIAPEDKIVIENHPQKKHLAEKQKRKVFLEEINNLYVALTRAKTNIFFSCMVGKKYKDVDKIKDLTGSKKDNQYFLIKEAIYEVCKSKGRHIESVSALEEEPLNFGELILPQSALGGQLPDSGSQISLPESGRCQAKPDGRGASGISLIKDFKQSEHEFDKRIIYAKSTYIAKQLEGSMVHEYLSHISHDKAAEHEIARKVLYQKYGDYFSSKEIDVICARCRAFVVDNNDIFAAQYLVFNEHIVFDGTKEYRIDRVMIDEANNKVWIVDYKTGEEKEQEQLDTYKKIVSELFIEKNGEYQIETRFVSF